MRGVANKGLLPEDALGLGLAASRAFGGRILIGRDTRLSGEMLARALSAGAASGGADVVDLGVLPTPGVAALAPILGAAAAGVVSASHNPYPDNGIKFFSGEGRKLSPEKEREIEDLIAEDDIPRPTGRGIGSVEVLGDAAQIYAEWVLGRLRPAAEGVKVLLDCANGAAYEVAPLVFGEVGADLTLAGTEPTGTNINDGCGSTHIEELDASGQDVAFAFDGDADRVLALDEKGNVVDGDTIIAILARDKKWRGVLSGEVVVTVMSNLGFFKTMEAMEIPYEVTDVGDRHVAGAMGRLGVFARRGAIRACDPLRARHDRRRHRYGPRAPRRDGPQRQTALGAGRGDGGVSADTDQREGRGAGGREGRRRLGGGRAGRLRGGEEARRLWPRPFEAERDGAGRAGDGRAY